MQAGGRYVCPYICNVFREILISCIRVFYYFLIAHKLYLSSFATLSGLMDILFVLFLCLAPSHSSLPFQYVVS